MVLLKNLSKSWVILALCTTLVAPTNHSHGEVVYQKRQFLQVATRKTSADLPNTTLETIVQPSPGIEVLRIQQQGHTVGVLLSSGSRDGLLPGSRLVARRLHRSILPNQAPRWVPTAILQTLEVRESYSLARVTEDGSADSGLHFPDAPGLMVGDRVETLELQIAQNLRILPTRVLSYENLFIDPKIYPTSFELSASGRSYLLEQAKLLVKAHSPLLLVEGHTDPQGDSQSNQIESYQRALTVRQVLIDEFGLDPNRVLAIGLGESEVLDEPYLPGRMEEARRIVLKVKSQALPH